MKLRRLLTINLLLLSIYFGTSSFDFEIGVGTSSNCKYLMEEISSNDPQTFVIVKIGNEYSLETLTSAVSKADFCGSFFTSKRNALTFDDGAVIELKSKNELLAEGINLSESCFLSDDIKFSDAVWSISPEGYLLKGHPHRLEKNQVIKN